jgi:hypothetical protein
LAVHVTAAASVCFFRREFDEFLYAAIGTERNEMPLTVLSALSRLDVDPWEEAAELSTLPNETAAQRLASLIARLPGGRWAQDAKAIADGLIELLPRSGRSTVQASEKARGPQRMSNSPFVFVCVAVALAALIIIAAAVERSRRSDNADASASSRNYPPQTSVPDSR